jgi:hypothetical protein
MAYRCTTKSKASDRRLCWFRMDADHALLGTSGRRPPAIVSSHSDLRGVARSGKTLTDTRCPLRKTTAELVQHLNPAT